MLGRGCFHNPNTVDDANQEPIGTLNDRINIK